MGDDCWGMSMAELDSLEREASQTAEARRAPRQPVQRCVKRLSVTISKHENGMIGLQTKFDKDFIALVKSVPGYQWNGSVWLHPERNLERVLQALTNAPGLDVHVEAVSPVVLPRGYVGASSPAKQVSVSSPPQARGLSPQCSPLKSPGPATEIPCSSPAMKTSTPPSIGAKQLSSLPQGAKHHIVLSPHHSGYIAAKVPPVPRLVSVVKSLPKSIWSPTERVWMFPASTLADAEKALLTVSDISTVEPLTRIVRRALTYMIEVPNLLGKYRDIPNKLESSLLPFQREGVKFVLQHGGRALIADEMGLGKTVQAIAVASCLQAEWPVLIIVPSSLRIQWAAMVKSWLGIRPSDITVVLSQGTLREGFNVVHSAGKAALSLDGLFNIISYDMIVKLQDKDKFKVIIADESHYMKNPQAKRTKSCVPLIQNARYAVLLTGTPALSRPIELFKQLGALQPTVYDDMREYGQRYCVGGFFGQYQGASNLEELHALLKTTVMIRRLKRDVLTQLPDKLRQQVFLALEEKNRKQLRALFNELKQVKERLQCSDEDGVEKLKMEEKQLITKIYSESAVAKLPAVQEYLSTMLEADCKFLIFAHHRLMLDGIEDHLKKGKANYIRIDGATTAISRQSLVTKFQESDSVKVAVLSIQAAGVGLTLTAASIVVFAEMSWTPGDLVQAEDRAHRLGQKSAVNIYYLHAQDTIDDLIWDSVRHKLENIGQFLDGKEEKLHLTPSPLKRQKKVDEVIRPCARSLAEQFGRPFSGEAGASSSQGEERNPKRPKHSQD